jgi:hypothetical protein
VGRDSHYTLAALGELHAALGAIVNQPIRYLAAIVSAQVAFAAAWPELDNQERSQSGMVPLQRPNDGITITVAPLFGELLRARFKVDRGCVVHRPSLLIAIGADFAEPVAGACWTERKLYSVARGLA